MSKDTYDASAICYLDDLNRDSITFALLASSARYLSKVYRIKKFASLSKKVSLLGRKSIPDFHRFTDEALMDDIKIGISLENYMKATLLNAGYLIHVIDGDLAKNQGGQLKTLLNKQKRSPVKITEYMNHQSFHYDQNLKRNFLG